MSSRVEGIDLLRLLSALIVFTYHYTVMFSASLPFPEFAKTASLIAPIGTNLLLLMAGYFCLQTRSTPGAYAVRRIVRLLAPLWVVLAIYLVAFKFVPSIHSPPENQTELLVYLSMNFMALNGLTGSTPISVVTWTIGLVLWPAILAVYLRNTKHGVAWMLVIAGVLVWYKPRILFFVLGGALAALKTRPDYLWRATIASAFFNIQASICLSAFLCLGRVRVHHPFLPWFGAISYCFYLCHPIGLHAARLLHLPMTYLSSGIIALALAKCLYVLVEQPARQVSDKVLQIAEPRNERGRPLVQRASA